MSEATNGSGIILDEATFQRLKEIGDIGEDVEKLAASMIEEGATAEDLQRFVHEYGLQGNPTADALIKEVERQLTA